MRLADWMGVVAVAAVACWLFIVGPPLAAAYALLFCCVAVLLLAETRR